MNTTINFRNTERDAQFSKEEAAALEELKRRCACQYDQAAKVIDKHGLVHNENCPVAKSIDNQGKQLVDSEKK